MGKFRDGAAIYVRFGIVGGLRFLGKSCAADPGKTPVTRTRLQRLIWVPSSTT